jgi:hypothetical protein
MPPALDGTGNVQSATGSYTRTDGSTGLVGNLEVVADTFYRDFTTRIELTAQAKALPTLGGWALHQTPCGQPFCLVLAIKN